MMSFNVPVFGNAWNLYRRSGNTEVGNLLDREKLNSDLIVGLPRQTKNILCIVSIELTCKIMGMFEV